MWRLTAYLQRTPDLSRESFVTRWRELFGNVAAHPAAAGGLRHVVLNLPVIPASDQLVALFGDRFDGVGELWFDSREEAVAILARLNADPSLRGQAAACVDRPRSINWLGEVWPQYEAPGTGVKFLVAGEPVDGWSIAEAQRYWREVHPPIFRSVPDFMAYVTRYVQTHGVEEPRLETMDWLGRYHLYPMCADMGLRSVEDVAIAYSLPSYLAIIRPDELKFSKQGDMLSFASEQELRLR